MGANECVLFSTCNRTELYVLIRNGDIGPDALKQFLISQKSASDIIQHSDMFTLTAGEAARHLYRVAAGIDSMVIGDVQILAQIKDGFGLASELGTAGTFMNRLFQLAFRVGKRARSETKICEGAASVSYAAIELAERNFSDLSKKTVLVVGAGETAELTATYLRDKNVGKIFVTNRTKERGEKLAGIVDGTYISFDEWKRFLTESDIVISSVETDRYILEPREIVLQEAGRDPLLIVDLGVPRNIDPAIKQARGVNLYDLDMLNTMVGENVLNRKREIPKVEAIIDEVLQELKQWYASLEVNPTITALAQFMEDIREEELSKNINRFEPKDRELVELVTKRIINKIIHAPIINLRNGHGLSMAERIRNLEAVRKLFGLEKSAKGKKDAE
jgi:glutamyl-tRNA reductase